MLKCSSFLATNRPSIDSCQIFAIGRNGSKAISNTGSSECSLQNDIYGRFQVSHFQINLKAVFKVPMEQYKDHRPRFVPHELFGITDLGVEVHKFSVTSKHKTNTICW